MITIDFQNLFADIWGYSPPEPRIEPTEEGEYEQRSVSIPTAPERKTNSSLGQPYFDSDPFGREFFMPVRIDGMLIPFAVISMNWRKTIVDTMMPERGGSVLEMISLNNYTFNIKGIFINEENEFPEEQIIQLRDLWKKNTSVEMRSVISDIVLTGQADDTTGHKVAIREIAWPAVSGIEHAKPFEMDLISDTIFDLELPAEFDNTTQI